MELIYIKRTHIEGAELQGVCSYSLLKLLHLKISGTEISMLRFKYSKQFGHVKME